MLTFVQNRENFSLFFACTVGGPIRETNRAAYAVMPRRLSAIKNRISQALHFQAVRGSSESVWRQGTMTVPFPAGIRHFPDFVLYLTYWKGGQYVQEIHPG